MKKKNGLSTKQEIIKIEKAIKKYGSTEILIKRLRVLKSEK